MKTIIKISLVTIAVFSLVLGQGSRMGTASSTQLLLPQGARYLSGGGAASSAVGMDAVYWNPAGLAMSTNSVDAIFSHRTYIADIGNNFFGVSSNFGKIGKVGFTARTFNIGDINETTVYQPDGTGQVYTPTYMVIGATVSKKLSDRTSVGATANWVSEGFGRVSANGLAIDLGVQYRSLMNIENLNVGFVIKNFGKPMTYEGEGLGVWAEANGSDRPLEYYKVDAASFDLPFTMDMSLGYHFMGADLGLTYSSNYYATDELRFLATYKLMGMAAVRVGYQSSMDAQAFDDEEDSWEYVNPFDGISFGGSLNLKNLTGLNLCVDYAYIPTKYFEDNQVLSLRIGF